MLRRLGWLIGLNNRSVQAKKLPDAKPHPAEVQPVVMLDSVQEIAIYIHRFHNLDLFQQGWYQLKLTVRWDNDEYAPVGTPARVVQYEAPSLVSDEVFGVWRIDDTDNSFATQPFRIKYARQDVYLSIMVAFDLPIPENEGPPSSAVILKFELLYAPVLVNGSDFQASPDYCPAAIHEFRIPPKALLGLHSYCPVYFDAFHAVLVDVSVHTTLLKAGSRKVHTKVPSIAYSTTNDVSGESIDGSTQVMFDYVVDQALDQVASTDLKQFMLVKALLNARDTLLAELQRLSDAINHAVDLTEFTSKMNDMKLFDSFLQEPVAADAEDSAQGKPQNGLERVNGRLEFQSDRLLHNLSKDDVLKIFNLSGDQVFYLWNTFLNFHRDSKTRILDFLRDEWAKDRRAEWSIWMVYSKVDMPHRYINGSFDESSHQIVHKRGSSLWKLTDDPAQVAAMRAELHRRSIAQMRMNNRSIQDMQIFGDPSGIPIVIIEHVMNAPQRTSSDNLYMRNLDIIDSITTSTVPSSEAVKKLPSASAAQSGRDLKIVIFVHGFQASFFSLTLVSWGHHLDLRLVRNQWLLIDPKIEFLMSEVNEEKTSGDFREMGLRLAHEVISFVKKKMDKASRSGHLRDIKLSFVGHSIGNVIIRTALAESPMEPYLRFLHTFVSLSGPHLGYLYSSNSLFNSGLWLLKKLKGTQCIHQLTFADDPDIRNTFFYKLCEDGYVPYHSARIESCRAASMDNSKKGKAFLEMLNNCLDQIRAPTAENRVFVRCDINFNTSSHGRNLNTLIGRAAHIEFLESDIFARFIMWSFPDLFQ
ncbi:protein FAM135B-like protein isoform X1 [Gossypium australe]|uniref:Protein FAM135B-like protein isoform X1 n=1 Tax=Gossypium australe TaxID=47621 RepID=A0A5B6W4J6_9ROSI|nr:protein FAM135B-like protein isoform X1 [Gossypium australe]